MPSDEPDLMRELDAAEEIVTGRAARIETEWGVRYRSSNLQRLDTYGSDEAGARRGAADVYKRLGGTLVRRIVTYGPWEEQGCTEGTAAG